MEAVSILLVGVGGYGKNYLDALINFPDPGVKIAGVCDPFAPKNAELMERLTGLGIPVFDAPEDFYRLHKADLAIISSPIHFHYPQAKACLENGSHVLCEKPICATLEDAEALLEAERLSGKFVAVGYQLCYSRTIQRIKADILEGRYGKPVLMKTLHMTRRGAKYYARNAWAGKREANGRPVYDSPFSNACAHMMNVMLFLAGPSMGEAARVHGAEIQTWRGNPALENFDAIALRCTAGDDVRFLYYTAHCMEPKNIGPMAEYTFENGAISYEDGVFTGRLSDGTEISYAPAQPEPGLQKLYDVIECVRTGERPVCTVRTAMEHTRLVEAARQVEIVQVPEDKIYRIEQDGDSVVCVRGLPELFGQCYNENALPRELSSQPL